VGSGSPGQRRSCTAPGFVLPPQRGTAPAATRSVTSSAARKGLLRHAGVDGPAKGPGPVRGPGRTLPPTPAPRTLRPGVTRALPRCRPGAPPRRLPAGRTVPRDPSGAACRWATRLQPNVASVATAARQSTHHQYSNHTVTVVRGGRPSGSPTEGSGLSRGGTPWGDNRSSEKVRRAIPAVGRRFPGEPTARTGAPFAP
jgi:hypothetical protein